MAERLKNEEGVEEQRLSGRDAQANTHELQPNIRLHVVTRRSSSSSLQEVILRRTHVLRPEGAVQYRTIRHAITLDALCTIAPSADLLSSIAVHSGCSMILC